MGWFSQPAYFTAVRLDGKRFFNLSCEPVRSSGQALAYTLTNAFDLVFPIDLFEEKQVSMPAAVLVIV